MRRFAALIALLLGAPAMGAESNTVRRIDINTATEEQIRSTLGVDADEAKRIIEARPYERKDDLKDRNVMSASEYEKLQKLNESVC
jgi:DNA uptake protein ComE-like DNA-binding protein